MTKREPPKHGIHHASKATLRKRVLDQTGASSMEDDAVDELDEAIQDLVTDLIAAIARSWQAQATSRQIQGRTPATPKVRTRHVLRGLGQLPIRQAKEEADVRDDPEVH